MTIDKLFVYGTLLFDYTCHAITGKKYKRQKASLKEYKKFAVKTGYPYIAANKRSSVTGEVLCGLTEEDIEHIDRYEDEGLLYTRIVVDVVITDDKKNKKKSKAYVYIGNIANLRRRFNDQIDMSILMRVEKFLGDKVGERVKILKPGKFKQNGSMSDEKYEKAKKELLGMEINYLVNEYFLEKYISSYTIDSELKIKGFPSLKKIFEKDEEIRSCAPYYIIFILKHMVFNQIEEKVHDMYGSLLLNYAPYWRRCYTSLAALEFLNKNKLEFIRLMLQAEFYKTNIESFEYIDLAVYAVDIAEHLYNKYNIELKYIVRQISRKSQNGHLPLGVELEFSNLGKAAVYKEISLPHDKFHNFKYFYDFDLVRRTWKLGGHIDDHIVSYQSDKHGGFLEYSLGIENGFDEYSRPVSNDPWIISELISNLIQFAGVKPHSVHLNIQADYEIDEHKENNIDYLKCLLLLAGDVVVIGDSSVERRIAQKEIEDQQGFIKMILYKKVKNIIDECSVGENNVLEYQFLRLSEQRNYENIIMALKGFQVGYRPRPFMSKYTKDIDEKSRFEMDELRKWAEEIAPLSNSCINDCISYIEKGLNTEKNGKPAHKKRYIDENLFNIEKRLYTINERIKANLTPPDFPYDQKERKTPTSEK
ncbi:gamma-glutamylcyclotransferase family protein [Spirochaetota bacterium]